MQIVVRLFIACVQKCNIFPVLNFTLRPRCHTCDHLSSHQIPPIYSPQRRSNFFWYLLYSSFFFFSFHSLYKLISNRYSTCFEKKQFDARKIRNFFFSLLRDLFKSQNPPILRQINKSSVTLKIMDCQLSFDTILLVNYR